MLRSTFYPMLLLCFAFGNAHADNVSITLTDTSGKSLANATLHVVPVRGDRFGKPAPVTTNDHGVATASLDSGHYVVTSKHLQVDGELNVKFTATFYPLAQHIVVGKGVKSFSMRTATLAIKNAQIAPLNLYAHYEDDKLKKARLALAEKHTGQIIDLRGKPTCSLELTYPANSIGVRGMHTYINAAFMGFNNDTMEADTYYYNGDVQWNHDVMMLGLRRKHDGGNRLVIKDVKKKSGAEIPFEPFMTTLTNGVVTNTYAHICFISSNKEAPAKPLILYRYIDDPGTEQDVSAVIGNATK